MELHEIPAHAKAEAGRWRRLAKDCATELAATTDPSHPGAILRHNLRVRHAELLLLAEQNEAQLAELAVQ